MLPLFAVMMVVLIGMAAFATDLGWMFVNASRIQRVAEASALSGVVELPSSPANAATVAVTVASQNGYQGGPSTTVTPNPQPGGELTQLEVTISDEIDLFFLSIFGMDTQTITRNATAEYLPPLPLGSPYGIFGNSCDPSQPGCTGQPNFWANIHGIDTDTRMGDAFSSRCADNTGSVETCPTSNAHRSSGYVYGIEANGAAGFRVQFLDIAHHNDSGGFPTSDTIRTGDRGCEDSWGNPGDPGCGMHMELTLYGPDATPLVLDNPVVCQTTVAPQPQVDVTDPYTWSSPAGCFDVAAALPGIYVLQVRAVDMAGNDFDDGLNRYSVRAQGIGGPARLYGLRDMALYNNAVGTTTDFFLAEVQEFYRGRTFVVELYDPGDAGGGGTVKVRAPNGAGWSTVGECEMFVRPDVTASWTSRGTRMPCEFFADNGGGGPDDYNGDFVKLEMQLPDTYTCAPNCWWKIDYVFPGSPTDTTTWSASMVGAPVHLIP